MSRMTVWTVLTIAVLAPGRTMAGGNVYQYRVLATSKTSTMQLRVVAR